MPLSGLLRDPANRSRFNHLALLLLLVPTEDALREWMHLWNRGDAGRLYEVDLLIEAFAPGSFGFLPKYTREYHPADRHWFAFRSAIAQPDTASRSAALARYMSQWNRWMKPYGWQPERVYCKRGPDGTNAEPGTRHDSAFIHFAFETALAVCAWDLDDAAFRDHPYYPAELVDHYRAHLRHTRDAWRPVGVGPDRAIEPLPAPKKRNLATSKAKGYSRWLELVCDGDIDAAAGIIDQTGRPRSLRKLADEVFCALGEANQAVQADIKDDATLETQLVSLMDARALEGFEPPDPPPAGPDRCERLLREATAWLNARAWRLYPCDVGDDDWHAVLVRAEFADEFEALSSTRGLQRRALD